jgi:RNA polymerase sigma-70 factor (ECF subfamily)
MQPTPLSIELEAAFAAHERMLWGLSYRLTGSGADADDVVQETFTRALEELPRVPRGAWRPWLVRVAANAGVDVLRRRRRGYRGPWLPAPVETPEGVDVTGDAEGTPEHRYAMLESASFAFLLALEALRPRQRAVLLLREVLDYSVRETAEALEISEPNVRILHHRARGALRAYDRDRCPSTRAAEEKTRRALAELVRCLVGQDAAGLAALLTEDARTVTDAGGEFNALRAPLAGRDRVARFLLRVAARRAAGAEIRPCRVNGLPALAIAFRAGRPGAAPRALLRCELAPDGRIRELHWVLASRKLERVRFEA